MIPVAVIWKWMFDAQNGLLNHFISWFGFAPKNGLHDPQLAVVSIIILTVWKTIGYNVFSQVYILASDVQGSRGYVVRVLVYDMIENGFQFFRMGYASAEAVILFLIVLVLTLFQLWLAKDKSDLRKGRA